MSHEQAAIKVGTYFKDEVADQLLNATQLAKGSKESELLLAHLDQKTAQFSQINFLEAIPSKKLKQTGFFTLGILGLLFSVTLLSGKALSEGSQRILAFDQEFVRPNPYTFEFISERSALRNSSHNLTISFTSETLPATVFIWYNGRKHEMIGNGKIYSHTITSVKDNLPFYIETGSFNSKSFLLSVIDKPWLVDFKIDLNFPAYTNIKDRTEQKSANLVVPEGTVLSYSFSTDEAVSGKWQMNDSTVQLNFLNNLNQYEIQAKRSYNASLYLTNQNFSDLPPHRFTTQVIPDAFPSISVQESADSIHPFIHHFYGACGDDYGIKKILLHYTFEDTSYHSILYQGAAKEQLPFSQSVDLSSLPTRKSNTVELHFEVFDNDGVNGSKSKISKVFSYQVPDQNSKNKLKEELAEEMEDLLSSAFDKSKELQKEQKQIKRLLLENKKLSWEDQQKISSYLQKQQSLRQDLSQIQKKSEEKNQKEKILSPNDEELLEKQKKIEELLQSLMDEETLKMFDELQKLLDQMSPEKTPEQLEQLQLQQENLSKSLDRTLELFKQMELQENLKEAIKNLEELSEKEKGLSQQKEANEKDEQQKIQEQFEKIHDDLKKILEKNEALDQKLDMKPEELSTEPTKENLNKAGEELKKDNGKKANEHQKKAAEEMDQLAQKLSQHQKKEGGQEDAEDLQAMRQLLENLIYLSVEQERLLIQSKGLTSQDPKYVTLSQAQKKLGDDAKIIEDSLFALSKRQIALSSFINKELHKISFNAEKAIAYLSERRGYQAAVNQQFVMTSANNLALILDESIQQMQDAAMKKQFGTGSCNKPGGSNPKPGSDMQQLKDQLSKQIEQMKKQLEQQGNKPADKGKKGNKGAAKSFAQMAAEQAALRDKLSKIQQQLEQQGKGGIGQLDQLIKELEQGEKDLYNQELSRESLIRQEKIMTKLLEAEKAIRERDLDDKRESETAKKKFNRNPEDFLEYKKTEISEEELLKILLPSLNLFYKNKVNEYFNGVD